jgi:hypothetical protein
MESCIESDGENWFLSTGRPDERSGRCVKFWNLSETLVEREWCWNTHKLNSVLHFDSIFTGWHTESMLSKRKGSHPWEVLKTVLVTPFSPGNSKRLVFIHFVCAVSDSNGLSHPREQMSPDEKAVLSISFNFLIVLFLNASHFERAQSILNVPVRILSDCLWLEEAGKQKVYHSLDRRYYFLIW